MFDETVYVIGNWGITTGCREYTCARDAKGSRPTGTLNENIIIGPALEVQVTSPYGRYCVEIKINSMQIEKDCPVGSCRGLDMCVAPLSEGNTNSMIASTSSPTVHGNLAPGRPMATNELSTPKFEAPPPRHAEQSNVSVKMPPPHFAGRVCVCRQAFTVLVEVPEFMAARRQKKSENGKGYREPSHHQSCGSLWTKRRLDTKPCSHPVVLPRHPASRCKDKSERSVLLLLSYALLCSFVGRSALVLCLIGKRSTC